MKLLTIINNISEKNITPWRDFISCLISHKDNLLYVFEKEKNQLDCDYAESIANRTIDIKHNNSIEISKFQNIIFTSTVDKIPNYESFKNNKKFCFLIGFTEKEYHDQIKLLQGSEIHYIFSFLLPSEILTYFSESIKSKNFINKIIFINYRCKTNQFAKGKSDNKELFYVKSSFNITNNNDLVNETKSKIISENINCKFVNLSKGKDIVCTSEIIPSIDCKKIIIENLPFHLTTYFSEFSQKTSTEIVFKNTDTIPSPERLLFFHDDNTIKQLIKKLFVRKNSLRKEFYELIETNHSDPDINSEFTINEHQLLDVDHFINNINNDNMSANVYFEKSNLLISSYFEEECNLFQYSNIANPIYCLFENSKFKYYLIVSIFIIKSQKINNEVRDKLLNLIFTYTIKLSIKKYLPNSFLSISKIISLDPRKFIENCFQLTENKQDKLLSDHLEKILICLLLTSEDKAINNHITNSLRTTKNFEILRLVLFLESNSMKDLNFSNENLNMNVFEHAIHYFLDYNPQLNRGELTQLEILLKSKIDQNHESFLLRLSLVQIYFMKNSIDEFAILPKLSGVFFNKINDTTHIVILTILSISCGNELKKCILKDFMLKTNKQSFPSDLFAILVVSILGNDFQFHKDKIDSVSEELCNQFFEMDTPVLYYKTLFTEIISVYFSQTEKFNNLSSIRKEINPHLHGIHSTIFDNIQELHPSHEILPRSINIFFERADNYFNGK